MEGKMFVVKNINLSMNVLLDEVNFAEFAGTTTGF